MKLKEKKVNKDSKNSDKLEFNDHVYKQKIKLQLYTLNKAAKTLLDFLIKNANFLMVIATFVMVIATFCTIREMRKENVLSKKTLNLMSQEFEMNSRPYVGVLETMAERKSEKDLILILHMLNVGKTPANDISIQALPSWASKIVINKEKEFDISKDVRIIVGPFPVSLFPQQRYIKRIGVGYNKMKEVYAGKKDFIVDVDVRYRGLTKIPKEKYYRYFIKVKYKHDNNSWEVIESSAY